MTTTDQERPYVDPGHVLPDADWAAVVRRAKEIQEEIQADAGGGASGPGGTVLDLTPMGVASKKYFGVSGIPTQLLVLHSAECPLQAGYAKSLSEWACGTVYPAGPVASWHRFIDPVHRVRLIPDELGAWHASEANSLSIGWEQAGYARYTRDQWLTADGRTQLDMLALDMAEVAIRDGIPARWLTTDEVRAVLDGGNRSIKGFCLHRQIDPETRTDPGDGYPYDLLMERIIYFMGGHAPNPEDDMALTPQQAQWLEYLASPKFKADIFTGSADVERNARAAFVAQVLNHGVQVGDTKQATSLAQFLRWDPSGKDNIYRAVLANGVKTDALTAAFTGAIAALSGGAAFDQEKFLASVEERVAAGMGRALAAVDANVTLTIKPEEATDGEA